MGTQRKRGCLTSIDVPHGSAYIGRNVETGGTLGFSFNTDVHSVAAFVDAADTSGISMAAYDAGKSAPRRRVSPVEEGSTQRVVD